MWQRMDHKMHMLKEQAACKSKQQVNNFRSNASNILQLIAWVYSTATFLRCNSANLVNCNSPSGGPVILTVNAGGIVIWR